MEMYKLSDDCYIDLSMIGKIWIEPFCWKDDESFFCYFLNGINKFAGKKIEIHSYLSYKEANDVLLDIVSLKKEKIINER